MQDRHDEEGVYDTPSDSPVLEPRELTTQLLIFLLHIH